MTQLRTDYSGPGSYKDIVIYVNKVLKQNFVPTEKATNASTTEPYERFSRMITCAILSRLNIEITDIKES